MTNYHRAKSTNFQLFKYVKLILTLRSQQTTINKNNITPVFRTIHCDHSYIRNHWYLKCVLGEIIKADKQWNLICNTVKYQ